MTNDRGRMAIAQKSFTYNELDKLTIIHNHWFGSKNKPSQKVQKRSSSVAGRDIFWSSLKEVVCRFVWNSFKLNNTFN